MRTRNRQQESAKMIVWPSLAAAVVVSVGAASANAMSYDVDSNADFAVMRANPSWDFTQTADINLNGVTWVPVGTSSSPFTGTFDGNGYKITNLSQGECNVDVATIQEYLDLLATSHSGLFAYTDGATIENVTLENVSVFAVNTVGALIADARTTSVSNCSATGEVLGNGQLGGLIGFLADSDVSDSWADVDIIQCEDATFFGAPIDLEDLNEPDSKWFGGFVGHVHPYDTPGRSATSTGNGSVVTNSQAMGDVLGAWGVGGFAGNIHGSAVIDCSATGDVDCNNSDVGGFVGFVQNEPGFPLANPVLPPLKTEMVNCSASGRTVGRLYNGAGASVNIVSLVPAVGGFVGYSQGGLDGNDDPTIFYDRCLASGDVYTLEPLAVNNMATGGFAGFLEPNSLVVHSRAWGGAFASGEYVVTVGGTVATGGTGEPLVNTGGFVGVSGGAIENCIAAGRVEGGRYSGGFVGLLEDGTSVGVADNSAYSAKIRNCESHGDVQSYDASGPEPAIGGFAGRSVGASATVEVTDSESHGKVDSSQASGNDYVSGGFVGSSKKTDYVRCAAFGDAMSDAGKMGGFCGSYETSTVVDSLAQGDVMLTSPDSNSDSGGFIGKYIAGTSSVTDSYAAGLVSASAGDVKGFIGHYTGAITFTTCYWDQDTSGQTGTQPSGVSGLSTSNMRLQAQFTGFDFTNVWDIYETVSYPVLK